MIKADAFAAQMVICTKYGAVFRESPDELKGGISPNVRDGVLPINGVRHPPESGTTGWYIWAGEHMETDDDFFKPLHVAHLEKWCPQVIKYLGLSPGWRFLVAQEYEDVWFDPEALNLREE